MVKSLFPAKRSFFKENAGRLTVFFILVSTIMACASKTAPVAQIRPEPAVSAIRFFQNVISPVDGDRCRMLPSCSEYADQSITKHGWITGWIMGCDRLIRCGGDEMHGSELTVRGPELYCNDPVSGNDFWWCPR